MKFFSVSAFVFIIIVLLAQSSVPLVYAATTGQSGDNTGQAVPAQPITATSNGTTPPNNVSTAQTADPLANPATTPSTSTPTAPPSDNTASANNPPADPSTFLQFPTNPPTTPDTTPTTPPTTTPAAATVATNTTPAASSTPKKVAFNFPAVSKQQQVDIQQKVDAAAASSAQVISAVQKNIGENFSNFSFVSGQGYDYSPNVYSAATTDELYFIALICSIIGLLFAGFSIHAMRSDSVFARAQVNR